MFKLGDKVKWTSSAGGVTRTKLGEVIEVVAPRMPPQEKVTDMGRPRPHESYVVRAVAQGTETHTRRVYWPRVVTLSLVEAVPTPESQG